MSLRKAVTKVVWWNLSVTDTRKKRKMTAGLSSSGGGGIGFVHKYIEDNEEKWIENLRQAVAIPSVSCWTTHRIHCFKMSEWVNAQMKTLGFTTEVIFPGVQKLDGEDLQIPPILLGALGSDPGKKTLLIYGHLDVQPAKLADGWDSEPFQLTERNDNFYGRGTSDDKGPVLGWLHAIEAFQLSGAPLPVNIKAVFECMEECGSEELENVLVTIKETFLENVDAVTISDSEWLVKDKPCLTYGLRGISYFFVEVEGGTKDLHSGVFGGTVYEALDDLIALLWKLKDSKGNLLIPGVYDDVAPLSEEEQHMMDTVASQFDMECYKSDAGSKGFIHSTSKETLNARWVQPSLTIHGIQGAFSDPGSKTVIPAKVTGKFSIRLVPHQHPAIIERLVKTFLEAQWQKLGSPNVLKVTTSHGGKPWVADYKHPNYLAAQKATLAVYGEEPLMTREGGSIPITLTFQELTGKNVLLLPMGQSDDGAHSQNEKISKRNYIQGTKLFASYLAELGSTTDPF